MKFDKLNSTLTLTANIGVLIGLILLVIELRQNDNNLNASIQLSLSSSYEELATFGVENPAFAESMVKAVSNPEEMTVIDTMNIMSWQYRYLVVLHTTFELYRKDIIAEEVWREKVGHFTVFLTIPKLMELYGESRRHDEFFSSEFYKQIEQVYEEQSD